MTVASAQRPRAWIAISCGIGLLWAGLSACSTDAKIEGSLPDAGDVAPPATPGPCAALQCDNGNACDGVERCEDGRCVAGQAPDCSVLDGPFTRGVCEPTQGCVAEPIAAGSQPRLLLISAGGIRPDLLSDAETPHLDSLLRRSAYSEQAVADWDTRDAHAWATVFAGVWSDKHEVGEAGYAGYPIERYPPLFHRLEALRPELDTRSISASALVSSLPLSGADQVQTELGDDLAVAIAAGAALLDDATLDLLALHFDDIDVAGHAGGFDTRNPGYLEALETFDLNLGRVLSALETREEARPAEHWRVALTGGFGGSLRGDHSWAVPHHRHHLLAVSGESPGELTPPPRAVDLLPTVLAHFDVAIDPVWALDGEPIDADTPPAPALRFGENLLLNGAGEVDRPFPGQEHQAMITGWFDPWRATVIEYGRTGWMGADVPGPVSRGRNYFAGGFSSSAWIAQRFDLAGLEAQVDAGELRYSIGAWLGGWTDQEDFAYVDLSFLETLPQWPQWDGAWFFAPGVVVSWDEWDDVPGGAGRMPLSQTAFAGMGERDPDAAMDLRDGFALLFHGPDVTLYDVGGQRVVEGWPQRLDSGALPGLEQFADGVDAAVSVADGRAWVFQGQRYVEFDIETRSAMGAARPWDDGRWIGVPEAGQRIRCATSNGEQRVYFFMENGDYLRYELDDGEVDFLRSGHVSQFWNGLTLDDIDAALSWRDLPASRLGRVRLQGPGPSERGGLTGLQAREASGVIPPGTRALWFQVDFVRIGGGYNDAYADGLSLVIDEGASPASP